MEEGVRSILLKVIFAFGFICLYGLFSAIETAIISLNKNKINNLESEKNEKVNFLLQKIESSSLFLEELQFGKMITSFFTFIFIFLVIMQNMMQLMEGFSDTYLFYFRREVIVVVFVFLFSLGLLIFGEFIPKKIALKEPEGFALSSIYITVFFTKGLKPFVKMAKFFSRFICGLLGYNIEEMKEQVTEEEIRMMIDAGGEILNETEKEMIEGVFQFDNTLAREVMTPRTSVFAIEVHTPIEEAIDLIVQEQYSRIPIYEDEIDNIVGILYMKDLFATMRKTNLEDIHLSKILRSAYFIPETKNIDRLFRELQHNQNHMAILIDEYGGLSGILTIEDLVEEIVGNISDEYDEDIKDIEKIDEHTYILDGLVNINEVNQKLDLNLPSDYFDTIGGFVVGLIGEIPTEDEKHIVEYENLVFKVERVNEKRIEKLKICIQPE